MSNKFKDIDKNIRKCYFSDNMINIENVDLNKAKIDKNSYENFFIRYIRYVTFRDLENVKINSVNPLYLIINKINGYLDRINENI